MNKRKFMVFILVFFFCVPILLFAETIYLKSGRLIEGKVEEISSLTGISVLHDGTVDVYTFDEVSGITGLSADMEVSYQEAKKSFYKTLASGFSPGDLEISEKHGAPIVKANLHTRKLWQMRAQEAWRRTYIPFILIGIVILFVIRLII